MVVCKYCILTVQEIVSTIQMSVKNMKFTDIYLDISGEI